MEIKVTLEAGQSFTDLFTTLAQALHQTQTPTNQTIQDKPKKQTKEKLVLETKEAPAEEINVSEAPMGDWSTNEVEEIDYVKLRAEVKTTAAQKRAAGQDVAVLIKKYGMRLGDVADSDLPALMQGLKAL